MPKCKIYVCPSVRRICTVYSVCGTLLNIRGFSKKKIKLHKIIQLNKNSYVSSLSNSRSFYSPHWLLAPCFTGPFHAVMGSSPNRPPFYFIFQTFFSSERNHLEESEQRAVFSFSLINFSEFPISFPFFQLFCIQFETYKSLPNSCFCIQLQHFN